MGTAGFDGSFAPIAQYEKWEIHPVSPHVSYFRLCQNLSPNLLAPLCGAVLIKYLVLVNNSGLDRQNAKIPSEESERMCLTALTPAMS